MKLIISLSLVLLGGIIFVVSNGIMPNYSDGIRTGNLQKFSHKGIVWKSYEGQLILDGLKTNGQTFQLNQWEFSCADPNVAAQIENLQGKRVNITYNQYLLKPIWLDSDYVAVKIEEAK